MGNGFISDPALKENEESLSNKIEIKCLCNSSPEKIGETYIINYEPYDVLGKGMICRKCRHPLLIGPQGKLTRFEKFLLKFLYYDGKNTNGQTTLTHYN